MYQQEKTQGEKNGWTISTFFIPTSIDKWLNLPFHQ